MNYYDDLEKGYDKTILISNLVRNALIDKQLLFISSFKILL